MFSNKQKVFYLAASKIHFSTTHLKKMEQTKSKPTIAKPKKTKITAVTSKPDLLWKDLYKTKDITALAIYTGLSRPKIYKAFNINCAGTKLTYEFNTYTIREQSEAKLLKSDNPIAIAVLASLYLIKAGKDVDLKFAYKKNLIEIARKKNFERIKLLRLINFVKYLVKLPDNLELEYTKFIAPPKNEKEMEYTEDFLAEVAPNAIKAIRERSMEKGLEKGLAEFEKEREQFIMNWHDKLGYNAEQIAPMMPKLTVKYIQSVIDKFEKKNKRK